MAAHFFHAHRHVDIGVEFLRSLRAEEAKPKLEGLFDWLWDACDTVANGSGTVRAIYYSLRSRRHSPAMPSPGTCR
jgi:hypothetical protein